MNCCGGDVNSFNPEGSGGWNVTSQQSIQDSASRIDETQAYIADALQNMSLEERDELYHELHGVADVVEETPEMLARCFQEMRLEIESNLRNNTIPCEATRIAMQMNQDYVLSERMLKIFLRTERFDIPKAAKRLIRFFEFKRLGFGDNHLCTDVRQDMLTESDLESYRKGFLQPLPWRDRMGRCITISFPYLHEYESAESLARIHIYISSCLVDDEESQRKGGALIVFSAGSSEKNQAQTLEQIRVSVQSLESNLIRFAVMHHCFSDQRFRFIIEFGLKLLNPEFRARNKLHFGAPVECLYQLMSFGIPQSAIPVNMHGEIKLKQHVERLKTRRIQEQWIKEGKLNTDPSLSKHDPANVILVPSMSDVLLGRGKPIHTHDGNNQLQQLVDQAIPQYESFKKLGKTQLSHGIVKQIKEVYGGRFVKQDPASGVWLVVDDETARLKVSHLFRARRGAVLAQLAKEERKDAPRIETNMSADGISNKRVAVMAG